MDDFGKEWWISPKILTDFLVFSEKSLIPLKRTGDFVKIKLQRTCFAVLRILSCKRNSEEESL